MNERKSYECHKCGTTSFGDLLFCPDCGSEIPSETNKSYINRKTGLSDDCLFEIDELWIEYYDEKKKGTNPNFEEYKQRRLEIIDRHSSSEIS